MLGQRHERTNDLFATLVRELLATTTFETLADLGDALKAKCAQLRIRLDPDDITEAYRMIGPSTALVAGRHPAPRDVSAGPSPISRTEAQAILQRLGVAVPLRSMPALRELTRAERTQQAFRDTQVKAFQIVATELLATERRIAALEREPGEEK